MSKSLFFFNCFSYLPQRIRDQMWNEALEIIESACILDKEDALIDIMAKGTRYWQRKAWDQLRKMNSSVRVYIEIMNRCSRKWRKIASDECLMFISNI